MTADATDGWDRLAQEEEAVTVIAGLLSLEPETEYTRSELAAAADIPLKTLYLVDTLEQLEVAGVLNRIDTVDEESEARFVLNGESEVYQAAVAFGERFAEQINGE